MNYGKHLNPINTPQTEAIPGREAEMTKNDAGGYTFTVTPWQQLTRFLILGSEGPAYYVDEKKNVLRNAQNVIDCIKKDGTRVVNELVAISDSGRAVKNDPAIFTLGLVMKYGDVPSRQAAYSAIPKVCRIGTHLFTLAQALKDINKGWGRGLANGVANWYLNQKPDALAFQVAKYQSRDNWSNRDLLRLSHPKTTSPVYNSVFKWVTQGTVSEDMPKILHGVEKAKAANSSDEVVDLIRQYNLPRECIPTRFLDNNVWKELLVNMPLTAVVRNLGQLTAKGVLTVTSPETQTVIKKLTDGEYIKKSRLHPISVLLALKQYNSGQGFKGSSSWTPVQSISSALEKCFYLAFSAVEPTGKNYFLGIDVSASMSRKLGTTNLTHCEAISAIAMTIMRTEPKYWAYGFCDTFVDLKINDSMSLGSVMANAQKNNFGSTDCGVPIQYAIDNKLDVDVFVILTDCETYAGRTHPSVLLKQYRTLMNKPNAKMIVLATETSRSTIADPKDPNMIDMVGFDASIPTAIKAFVSI